MYTTTFPIPDANIHIVCIGDSLFPATLAKEIIGYSVVKTEKGCFLQSDFKVKDSKSVEMHYFSHNTDILVAVEGIFE